MGNAFDYTAKEYTRDDQSGVVITLRVTKPIQGVAKQGAVFKFYVRRSQDGSHSVLTLSKRLTPVFVEFLSSCFKWLFSGLAFEVKTNGGFAEQETARFLRVSLVTFFEAPKPKIKVETGK